jgi:hypothetical protein
MTSENPDCYECGEETERDRWSEKSAGIDPEVWRVYSCENEDCPLDSFTLRVDSDE